MLKNTYNHEQLKKSLYDGSLPHILLTGSSGVGKTTLIKDILHDTFNDKVNERVLWINAITERGIQIIKASISSFVKQTINIYDDMPSLKVVVIDQAYALTYDSQYALRGIIETYSHICRFIFITSFEDNIIDAIRSRCVKIHMNKPSNDVILNILSDNPKEIHKVICEQSNGIIKRALNIRDIYDKTGYSNIVDNEKAAIDYINKVEDSINNIVYGDYDIEIILRHVLKHAHKHTYHIISILTTILNGGSIYVQLTYLQTLL